MLIYSTCIDESPDGDINALSNSIRRKITSSDIFAYY